MAEMEAIKIGGGALAGAVAAIFGIKKIIKAEICEGMKPRLEAMQKEIDEVKDISKTCMSADQHESICKLTSNNFDNKFDGMRDFLEAKFDDLNHRIGRQEDKK